MGLLISSTVAIKQTFHTCLSSRLWEPWTKLREKKKKHTYQGMYVAQGLRFHIKISGAQILEFNQSALLQSPSLSPHNPGWLRHATILVHEACLNPILTKGSLQRNSDCVPPIVTSHCGLFLLNEKYKTRQPSGYLIRWRETGNPGELKVFALSVQRTL